MNATDEGTGSSSENEATPATETAVAESGESTAEPTEANEAAAEATEAAADSTEPADDSTKFKMSLNVVIEDVGPCKKHVQVRVPKDDINHYYLEAVGEMMDNADVPGFRVGHAPKRLIQRKYRKELYGQVKQQVLIDSLEQMAEDYDLDPINEPDFGLDDLEIRGDQDFEYEFDVEVRPNFELPDYEGITIERPVREITDAHVESYLQRFLSQYGELVPHDGPAEKEDFVTVSIDVQYEGTKLRGLPEVTAQLKPILRFQDSEVDGFDELMAGVSAGESRETDLTISTEAEEVEMRGETVHARFEVNQVKKMELPELSKTFFQRIGVESKDDLLNEIRETLERQVTYQQRQSARQQVLEKITNSADWELPEELVLRQTENALRREILEMQQAGFTTQEIQARENDIRQRAISVTRQALMEHFVLDKIATQEKVEVTPSDIEGEIYLMALQRGENPRRVRARLHKSGMIENLEAQIYERKAIDIVLERAKYEEVEMEETTDDTVEAVPQSICGVSAETSITGTLASSEADENG